MNGSFRRAASQSGTDLIQQHLVGIQLFGQGNGFSLAIIQIVKIRIWS